MKATSIILLCCLILALDSQGPARSATALWSFATPEPVLASPTIAQDGTLYLASYDRNVYALTPGGSVKWTNNLPPPIYIYFGVYTAVYGTPAVGTDGTLYVPSENGKLLALNPTNGAVKWDYSTVQPEGLYSSPALGSDGTIYFGSYDGNLYAVNPNGTKKWSSRFGSTIFASPAVGRDGTIYCGCDDGKLYALNPNNGSKKWTFNSGPYTITASPAIATNNTLYIGVGSTNNPKFYSVSTDGTTNWTFTTGSRVRSSAALAPDGTIYFGCDDTKLYALNPNGTKKWDFTCGGAVGSSPAVAADGTICFGCNDGKLYALDGSGHLLWTFQTGDYVFASPAIGPDGTIYFASADGSLYVVGGSQPPAASGWAMFRHDLERTGRATSVSANSPPSAALTSPTNGASFIAPANITLAASSSDTDGTISKVEFFEGANKLGEDATSPYSFGWNSVAMGSYTLTVRATDDRGATTTSAAITISVVNNAPPTASLTNPTDGASFIAPANITLAASSSDTDGTISKVEFFEGANKLGEDDTGPYSFGWNSVAMGSYTLTVRATDDRGATTTSAAITISVVNNAPPTVTITSPTNGTVLTAPATFTLQATASDSDGSVSQVEFFNGGTSLGIDPSSPYSVPVNDLAAGNYTLSAVATDNLGAMATNSVSILVNSPPQAVTVVNPMWSGSDFLFSFASQSGRTYEAQYSDALGSGHWELLTTLTGDGSTMTVTNRDVLATQRFYRVESK